VLLQLVILSIIVLNNKKEDKRLTKRDYIGWGLWAVGFILETVADYQKSSFRSNPDNAVILIFKIISYVMYMYDKFTNIRQSMLKVKTHSGFHDLFRF
jgi:steroid 5-alpha reductase family enzyme